MEKYLANCFDYQKFENHAGLQAVINDVCRLSSMTYIPAMLLRN